MPEGNESISNRRAKPLSDSELARRLRLSENETFLDLVTLRGSDLKAVQAIREEGKFVQSHRDLPRGKEFARKVRTWLAGHKLEWNQQNLESAVAAVTEPSPDSEKDAGKSGV